MGRRLKEGQPIVSAQAEATTDHNVAALRSALRSAPRKKGARSRSPLKAAVAQLLPDLLAFRAKGYNGAELAKIMRDNGFIIAATTLNKYINEARTVAGGKRKKKAATKTPALKVTTGKSATIADKAAEKIVVPPSLLATKPLAQNKRTAKDVLGHRFDDDI
jgi:hypothetical protein